MLSYRALESIFGNVFDKAEPQLNLRWNLLKNRLGLPYRITLQALQEVSQLADAELSALVLLGGSSLNPGLPLTDNQKFRRQHLKDAEKRKAAAVRAATPTPPSSAAAQNAGAVRLSSTMSPWADPCNCWKKGECKGIKPTGH